MSERSMLFAGCVFVDGGGEGGEDMSLENLIKMQSSGARSIEEPNTPRPGGVPQGTVLVMLDVTKEVGTAAVYWALGNVVRRGDNFKIVGIVTHTCNPMGFRTRVDKTSWLGSNGLLLQHELTMKRIALENVPHVKEWCEKAGVNLELDVKAGYVTKVIIVDEARAVGAYHVVLDKSMKSDRKYFIEHLTCFVSRARQSGGVETIRSFSVTKQLPPLVPTPSNARFSGQLVASSGSTISMASLVSHVTSRGSVSSGSFGVASSDGFHTQSSDAFSAAPTTSDSLELVHEIQETGMMPPRSLPYRALQSDSNSMVTLQKISDANVAGMNRLSVSDHTPEMGYNLVNRKPALRKWLTEDEPAADMPPYENSINNSFNDRSTNGNGNKILANEQQLRRVSPPVTMEKPANVASPGGSLLQSAPGRMFAPGRMPSSHVTALPTLPVPRMPSPPTSKLSQSSHKTVWIWTRSKDVMRAAVELGWTTFIFTPDTKYMAPQWASIEWIKPLFLEGGRFLNQEGKQVALLGQVYSSEQLDYLPAMMGGTEVVVINDLDWQVIPPEEIVAAFQGRRTQLFATANTAADAQVYLEALEVGTSGVVLHTDNCSEITALKDYLTSKGEKTAAVEAPINEPAAVARSETNAVHRVGSSPRSDTNPLNRIGSSPRLVDSPRISASSHQNFPPQEHHGLRLINATVKSVVSVGEGDRVSVDLCNLLNPGEALLVGSFSKGMFLVHSEVQDNNTSRRSFRVNAGPVHAYTGMAEGHITYLSELESGSHVVAVDAHGNHRTVLVGRVSIESKPLVLVNVEAEGESFSVMLQDADSVRLVVPAEKQRPGCEAIAVTKLQSGDMVLLSVEDDDTSYEQ